MRRPVMSARRPVLHRTQHALIGNMILLLLVAAAVVATGGVDWWPPR
jgi:hypothetical protein